MCVFVCAHLHFCNVLKESSKRNSNRFIILHRLLHTQARVAHPAALLIESNQHKHFKELYECAVSEKKSITSTEESTVASASVILQSEPQSPEPRAAISESTHESQSSVPDESASVSVLQASGMSLFSFETAQWRHFQSLFFSCVCLYSCVRCSRSVIFVCAQTCLRQLIRETIAACRYIH